ncbi:expressed unknown protein [Seminavis robusta]|uniref:G-protein coupled receptors family 1 profile domain-containing protein n=1 Tax=Seminavis robusta TaxID=568900 RepID=A0A9N8EZ04_9STRA|nr:expressed unknown protein [Seminavis robusta]|eukprot:Sro2027_g311720.1 n/a (867) ;mRNA; f:9705-12487
MGRLVASLSIAAVLLALVLDVANGQFLKQGCNELAPLVCPDVPAAILPPRPSPSSDDDLEEDDDEDFLTVVQIETVCRRLFDDGIIPKAIELDVSRHGEYLDSIDATDPFCAEIQVAYGQCLFCATQKDRDDCTIHSREVRCGGQPTKQEIIMDNTNYPLYQTEEDIAVACDALQTTFADGKASSMDLCERHKQIKHLCPRECSGGCFVAEEYPPTCEANTTGVPVSSPPTGSPTMVTQPQARQNNNGGDKNRGGRKPACDRIIEKAFFGVDADIFLNTSNHLEYFQSIPAESNFCPLARESYKDCIWCNLDNLCFSEENPPSCDPPEGAVVDSFDMESLVATEEICSGIDRAFFGIDDIFDASAHAGHIAIQKDSELCGQAQQVYHKCFWCAKDVPAEFCSTGAACDGIVSPDEVLPPNFKSVVFDGVDNKGRPRDASNCEGVVKYLKDSVLYSRPHSLQGCYEELLLVKHCREEYCPRVEDAPERDDHYLGATTDAEKMALIWVSRASAILSFLGASFVLFDSLSDGKARETVYHQLLIGMAIMDLVTAVSWCFATIPIDTTFSGTDHILGAMGNEASCKAQGFFIQLGFTSVYYNVSLALYYVLVIARDWKEFHLKKIRLYLHAVPCTVGLGLALGALGSYNFMGYACHLLPHPEGSLGTVMLFVIIPLGFSVVAITASMLVVYGTVRSRAGASRKWSFGVGSASKLEQAVFWQCLFYAMAFYITWPIMFAVYLGSVGVDGPLGLSLTIAFVAPLSGFTNFLVYIRPKIVARRKKRAPRQSIESASSSPSTIFVTAMMRMFRRTGPQGSSQNEDYTLRGRNVDPSVLVAVDPTEDPTDPSGAISSRPSRLSLSPSVPPELERS